MKKIIRSHWSLIIIIMIAGLFRFYKLNQIPHGITWDEAAITYNAWAISLWNRDEFANFLPLSFKSFGDYKAPLLIYLLAIPFKLFGISESLLRITTALSSLSLVPLIYILAGQLLVKFDTHKRRLSQLAAALFMAISAWAVPIGRVGFEANIAIVLVVIFMIAFFSGFKRSMFWYLATISASLSLYAYHSTKIVMPLILLMLLLLYRKEIFVSSRVKHLIVAGLLFIGLTLPLAYQMLVGEGGQRSSTLLLYDQKGDVQSLDEMMSYIGRNIGLHLNPSFLAGGLDSVGERHLVRGFGIFYPIELALLLIGVIYAIRKSSKETALLIAWLLIGFVPSLLSRDAVPHALRSLTALPAGVLLSGLGVVGIYELILKKINKQYARVLVGLMLMILFINGLWMLKTYVTEYRVESAEAFQTGYKEALVNAAKLGRTKDKIVVTDTYGQPYIYVLLYNRITPEQFLAGALAIYEFRPIKWPEIKERSVFVATPNEIPQDDPSVIGVVTIPGTDEPRFVIAVTE